MTAVWRRMPTRRRPFMVRQRQRREALRRVSVDHAFLAAIVGCFALFIFAVFMAMR